MYFTVSKVCIGGVNKPGVESVHSPGPRLAVRSPALWSRRFVGARGSRGPPLMLLPKAYITCNFDLTEGGRDSPDWLRLQFTDQIQPLKALRF